MPKMIIPPTPENTYRGEEKFVKKLYATPTQIIKNRFWNM